MKSIITILFSLIVLTSFGQTAMFCDTIYDHPEIPARYTNDIKALYVYSNKKLTPILSDCIKKEGEMITRLQIKLTIDKTGKVSAVDFPKLQASKSCQEILRSEILTMTGWIAGQSDGKNVCSNFYWPINCLKWE